MRCHACGRDLAAVAGVEACPRCASLVPNWRAQTARLALGVVEAIAKATASRGVHVASVVDEEAHFAAAWEQSRERWRQNADDAGHCAAKPGTLLE